MRGGSVKINGTALPAFASPSSYLSLNRTWKSGDKIELNLPMALAHRCHARQDTIQAAMYGPLVLVGRFDAVPNEMSYGDYEPKAGGQQEGAGHCGRLDKPTAWIEPDRDQPLTFHAVGQSQPLTLIPLNRVIHERYAVYWKVNHKSA